MDRFSIDRTFETLARAVVRFRWFVVAFWLVAAIVVSGAFPSLGSEVNNDNTAFLRATAPSTKAANLAAPLLGGSAGNTSQVIVVASRAGKLTAADLSAIQREASAVRNVNRVLGIQGVVVSSDGQAVQLRIRVNAARNDIGSDETIVNSLENTLTTVNAPAGLHLHLAGQIATAVANQASSNRSGNHVQLFSFLFIIVLLLFVFRSVLAPLVTLLPGGHRPAGLGARSSASSARTG